jgi:hypothetical protein
MTTSTAYPNGQVLISSALTPNDMNRILQPLTCGMLGINPPDYKQVRIDWQSEGQPFQNINVDVCYLACVPKDEEYSRVRDRVLSGSGPVVETWTYTKGWRISWCFYGPNSEDRARMIRSAMFMDYFNEQLNVANLYPLSDPPEVTRSPENLNAQWFERADFYIDMYEQVTESIEDAIVTSVEIKIEEAAGEAADFIVTKP